MTIIATLCYIIKDDYVLLIRKKQGFGAGKINAPGGKVEPGETLEEATIREVEEETGLKPKCLEYRGVLEFYSMNEKPDWVVHVFIAKDYEGDIRESNEAEPHWFKINEIPYDKMWEDTAYWLPHVLKGKIIHAKFKYDKDYTKIISYEIRVANKK